MKSLHFKTAPQKVKMHLCNFQCFSSLKTSLLQMIPHTFSNSVQTLCQEYILMDCFCCDTQTLDLPPGLQAIVGPTPPSPPSSSTRQPDLTPPPPSKVPRHHILVLLPVITTPITSQREQTQPHAKLNSMDSHDTV